MLISMLWIVWCLLSWVNGSGIEKTYVLFYRDSVTRWIILLIVLKIKSVLSVFIFCILHFKSLLATMKTLTNSRYLTGSRIRISSGEQYVFLSSLYKQHWQRLKENGKPQFSIIKSWQPIIPTVILKSNAITSLKILSGLRNNLQNHRWLPECRNKHFEEGYWKDFNN